MTTTTATRIGPQYGIEPQRASIAVYLGGAATDETVTRVLTRMQHLVDGLLPHGVWWDPATSSIHHPVDASPPTASAVDDIFRSAWESTVPLVEWIVAQTPVSEYSLARADDRYEVEFRGGHVAFVSTMPAGVEYVALVTGRPVSAGRPSGAPNGHRGDCWEFQAEGPYLAGAMLLVATAGDPVDGGVNFALLDAELAARIRAVDGVERWLDDVGFSPERPEIDIYVRVPVSPSTSLPPYNPEVATITSAWVHPDPGRRDEGELADSVDGFERLIVQVPAPRWVDA